MARLLPYTRIAYRPTARAIRQAWVLLWLSGLGTITHTHIEAALPQLTDLQPRALAPGKTTEVVLRGANLLDVTKLWMSCPARCEILAPVAGATSDGQSLRCRITIGREESIGIAAVRVATKSGVSPWLLLMIDDLPTTTESKAHSQREATQPTPYPCAIDGFIDPLQSQYFRVHAEAKQILSFEVVAQRIGSPCDAKLILLDEHGVPIAQADDDFATGADSRLTHEFVASGDYFLALRDVRFRGGGDYRYRLRIGRFPLLANVYPLGGRASDVADFEWFDPPHSLVHHENIRIHDLAARLQDQQFVSLCNSPGQGSGFVTCAVGEFPEFREAEPNSTGPQANPVPHLPCVLNGRFEQVGDVDMFQVSLEKDQRVRIMVETRRFGSPADVGLRLQAADGTTVGEAASDAAGMTQLVFTASAAGSYAIVLEDALRGGSAAHAYRATVEPATAGFTLQSHIDTCNIPQGGTFVLKVSATRLDYAGPIALQLDGLPPATNVTPAAIPADKSELEVAVTVPAELSPGSLTHFRLVGEADVNGKRVRVTASTLPALRARMADSAVAPRFLDSQLALGVGPPFASFFALQLEGEKAYYGRRVGKSTCKVQLQRLQEGFQDPVELVLEGVPENCKADVKPIGKGEKEAVITLTGPPDLPVAMYSLKLIGKGVFQYQSQQFVLADIPLHVISPLRVTVNASGPLVVNTPQKLAVRVQRFGDERNPVSLQWKQGPAGLLAPIQASIPADQEEISIMVVPTLPATSSPSEPFVVTATTVVQGEPVVVDSVPFDLPIATPSSEGT